MKPEQDLEQLKALWGAQEDDTMFAIDQEALDKKIRINVTTVDRALLCFQWVSVLIILTMLGAAFYEPLFHGHDLHQLFSGSMQLLVLIYWVTRWRQHKARLKTFAETVTGELDRAIYRLDFLIRQYRAGVWWFILPLSLGAVVGYFAVGHGKPFWVWPLTAGAMLLTYWTGRNAIKNQLVPQLDKLKALRRSLNEA